MKRFAILACLFAFLMTLIPGAAMADVKTHEEAGVQIWTPDDWAVTTEADQLVVAHESGVAIVFVVVDGEDLSAAVESIDDELSQLKDFKVTGEAKAEKINELDALTLDGTATIEGAAVEVGVALIDAPKAGKVIIAIAIGTPEAIKAQAETLAKVIMSIKKA
jgi:hypothetical protein